MNTVSFNNLSVGQIGPVEFVCNGVFTAEAIAPSGNGSERESRMAQIAKDIPMQKMGMASDVANAVLFFSIRGI